MSDATSTSSYVFDPDWQRERERLSAIGALLDDGTKRLLAARGLGPGWRCLEVGCGAGTVAT